MRRAFTLLAIVLILVACTKSSPTIDASSDEAMKASIQKVQESMSGEKRAKFQASVMLITLSGMSVSDMMTGADGANRVMESVKDKLNGKTGDEVIALAEEIKQERGWK